MEILGKSLREARIARDLSIDQLHEMTKIETSTLEKIEKGEADHLAPVYYRAFVRSMADAVGLDPEKLLAEFNDRHQSDVIEQDVSPAQSPKKSTLETIKENSSSSLILLGIIAVVAVLVILLIIFGKQLFIEPDISQLQTTSVIDTVNTDHSVNEQSDIFILLVKGIAASRIVVQIDSATEKSILLKKDEIQEWVGEKQILLRLSNCQAVELFLNDKPLTWSASPGSGASLVITTEGIERKSILQPPMIGHITLVNLFERFPMFSTKRDQYQPDEEILSEISALNPSLSLLCFIGTWHATCRNEVPKILRILDDVQLPDVSIVMIGVDRTLNDKAGMASFHEVDALPTLIILDQGVELGRISGKSEARIEKQVLQILQSSYSIQER